MRTIFTQFLVCLIFAGVTAFSLRRLSEAKISAPELPGQIEEVLYLPSGVGLRFLSFGYQNTLSQLLWFNTISYFGKHYRQDQNYRWLGHMCSLVTALNPLAKHTYLFCSAMLAWEANEVELSNSLLTQSMRYHPDDWYLYYLRGFNYTYFLKDQRRGHEDFVAASKLPNANLLVVRLAAKTLSQLESPETAIEFLMDAIERTSDPSAKHALRVRLERLKHESMGSRP
jgi:hypothetical protein